MKPTLVPFELKEQYERMAKLLEHEKRVREARGKWKPEVWQTATVFFFSSAITIVVNFAVSPGTSQWDAFRETRLILAWMVGLGALTGFFWWNSLKTIQLDASHRGD